MVERKLRPSPSQLVSIASRKAPRPERSGARSPAANANAAKLFVLDTNVLMHDPTSLFRFEEHDIYLPIFVLEELDSNKKGVTEVARNARQVVAVPGRAGHDAGGAGRRHHRRASRSPGSRAEPRPDACSCRPRRSPTTLPPSLANGKADNQILAVVMHVARLHPKRSVILVSKDINMRIKARALGMSAEDYYNDKVLEDTELPLRGMRGAARRLLGPPRQGHGVVAAGRHTIYR